MFSMRILTVVKIENNLKIKNAGVLNLIVHKINNQESLK